MKLKIPQDVMFRILGGEAVLLNLASGTYFGLDEVGTRMWQLMSEHGSTDKVVEIMLEEYEVEESLLQSDLDKLVKDLTDNGLVQLDAPEAAPTK
jgi:hypothetical protein